jgi:hypothetical protein
MFDIAVPDIEEGIPLPERYRDALPELSPAEELEMRSRTAKLLAELSDTPLVVTDETRQAVNEIKHVVQSGGRPDYSKYPNEALAFLAEMVSQFSYNIVEDLSDLRSYIVNKLINEVETAKSSKDRIAALSKLGEVDGVNAFTKRSELTLKVKPIEEVEKELLNVLEGIEYAVLPREELPTSVEEVDESPEDNGPVEEDSDDAEQRE